MSAYRDMLVMVSPCSIHDTTGAPLDALGYVQNHQKFNVKIFAKKPLFAILVAQKRDKYHGEASILGLRLEPGE